eukprot:RCo004323
MAFPSAKRIYRKVVTHLLSLKVLLIVAFVALMVIAGFLGFYLTYIQGQLSLREIAEVDMLEGAQSVVALIQAKVEVGHLLNHAESSYFRAMGQRLDNWVTAYYAWKPLATANMLGAQGTYIGSVLQWPGMPGHGHALAVNPTGGIIAFASFNASVCNDTAHFPGSDCNLMGLETYLLNPMTLQPMWDVRILYIPNYDAMHNPAYITGAVPRSVGWRSSPANLFNPGYSAIDFTPNFPPYLVLELNGCVL